MSDKIVGFDKAWGIAKSRYGLPIKIQRAEEGKVTDVQYAELQHEVVDALTSACNRGDDESISEYVTRKLWLAGCRIQKG